jgi:hypothetical protein
MKNTLIIAAVVAVLFVQCGEEKDPFLIGNGSVGPLNKEVQMKQVDSLFANDSIVKLNPIENAIGTQGEVMIYDKDGSQLLLISPDDESDPDSKITNIQIFDNRYKTEKGLHIGSTFKDVKANYTIKDVETTINAVVVFLEESEVFLTIDKKQLSENLRYDPSIKIDASMIPDDASFKYFMIGWDRPE